MKKLINSIKNKMSKMNAGLMAFLAKKKGAVKIDPKMVEKDSKKHEKAEKKAPKKVTKKK